MKLLCVSMNPRKENHFCIKNRNKHIEIRFENINAGKWSWIIEQIMQPIELKDDSNQPSTQLETLTAVISYCPFCGENLQEGQKNIQ
jgi:hypothetical protein